MRLWFQAVWTGGGVALKDGCGWWRRIGVFEGHAWRFDCRGFASGRNCSVSVCTSVCLSCLLLDWVSVGIVLSCVVHGLFGLSGRRLLFLFRFVCVLCECLVFVCFVLFVLLYCVYYWFLFLGFILISFVYGLPGTGILFTYLVLFYIYIVERLNSDNSFQLKNLDHVIRVDNTKNNIFTQAV